MRSKFFVFKTLEIQYNKVSTGKSSINKTCKKPAGLRCKRHARYFDGAATGGNGFKGTGFLYSYLSSIYAVVRNGLCQMLPANIGAVI